MVMTATPTSQSPTEALMKVVPLLDRKPAAAVKPAQQQQQHVPVEPITPLVLTTNDDGPARNHGSSSVSTTSGTNVSAARLPDRNTVRRVLVIGAGMSGLAAANELEERGYEVLVLEARNRVGGRLKAGNLLLQQQGAAAAAGGAAQKATNKKTTTTNSNRTAAAAARDDQTASSSVDIDLGGALIHGVTDNPVYGLAQDMGIATLPVQDCLLLTGTGWPVDPKEDERTSNLFNECLEETFLRITTSNTAAAATSIAAAETAPAEHGEDSTTTVSNETTARDGGADFGEIATTEGTVAATPPAEAITVVTTPAGAATTATQPPTAVVPEQEQSFGHLFEKVCAERNVNSQGALFRWHKSNLEVSCGASFNELGWQWNEDEPYGFDGDHVAVSTSWKAVTHALADPLTILHDARVVKIQIVHPPAQAKSVGEVEEEDVADASEEVEQEAPLEPAPKRPTPAALGGNARRRRVRIAEPTGALPSRQSRRIRGEDALARRSPRSNKGSGVSLFTVDHSVVQVLHDVDKKKRRRETSHVNLSDNEDVPTLTKVQVTLASGMTLEADAVVCTLPLGILKQKEEDTRITFDPPLSSSKQQAIDRLGTGLLNKCALTFSSQFWQDSEFLGLADDAKAHSYLVLNAAKYTGKSVLLFMYGGSFAREIEEWTDSEVVEDCLAVLKRICGRDLVTAPLDYQMTRWGKEQYSRMSFTYVPPGVDGIAELQAMSQPVMDHTGKVPALMFAGEHTTPYHPSTIHGAFLSGIREAYRLDCTMEPEANEHLEFTEDNVYQKTFDIKKKFRAADAAIATISEPPKTKQPVVSQAKAKHRRRGAAGVMKLRSRPKTVLKENASASSPKRTPNEPATLVVAQQSSSPQPSRRSQRSVANVGNGAVASSNFARPPPSDHQIISSAQAPRDLAALEDRAILRGLESYGDDFDYIGAACLPVHGSTKVKSVPQIQQRCRQLFHKANKMTRNRRKSVASVAKSWVAKTVAPPSADTSNDKSISNGRRPKKTTNNVQNGTANAAATTSSKPVTTRSGRTSRPRV